MKLFISYRRDDTDDFAGRLFDNLKVEFGTENIFKDVDSIRPGQNWKVKLEQSIVQCDMVLVLIGKQWLGQADETGKTRIKSEDDWVRFELEAAQRHNRVLVPILVKDTKPLRNSDLPDSLHWLTDINATTVRGGADFNIDVKRLIDELKLRRERLASAPRPQPGPTGPAAGPGQDLAGHTICQNCRRSCLKTDKFCDGCGGALWTNCPKCVVPILASQRFCNSCGTDVVQYAQGVQQRDELFKRLNNIRQLRDPLQQLNEGEQLTRDIAAACSLFPLFKPLHELQSQVNTTVGEVVKAAANDAYQAKQFGRAVQLYQRLDAFGAGSSEGTQRLSEMLAQHRTSTTTATEQFNKGDIRKAHTTLTELHKLFPEDANLAEQIKHHAGILDRVKQLTETGIRSLLSQHRLVQLDKEITWLYSTKMNIQKLQEIATDVRRKLSEANTAIAKAQAEMASGNVREAQNIARGILEVVVDHEEANKLVRQSGELVDKVAQLQELVQQEQWSAARALERQIEKESIVDPRLPKLAARIKAGLSVVDHQLILLGIVTGLMLVVAFYGIPWLVGVMKYTTELPGGYYMAAGAAVIVLVMVLWFVFSSRAQMIQRLMHLVMPPRRKRSVPLPPQEPVVVATEVKPLEKPAEHTSQAIHIKLEKTGEQPTTGSGPTSVQPSPLPKEAAAPLSVTELDQRLENTCTAVEWLTLTILASMLGYVVMFKFAVHIPYEWLRLTVMALSFTGPQYLVYLVMNRRARWISPLATLAMTSQVLVFARLWFMLDLELYAVGVYLSVGVVAGVIGAALFRTLWWKGIVTAVAGSLLAILIASPFVALVLLLSNWILSGKGEFLRESLLYMLLPSAIIWTLLTVIMSSPSGTLVRWITAEDQRVRGVFSLALALIVASLVYLVVVLFSIILNEKSLWITSWIALFLVCQTTTALIKWRWSMTTSITQATVSFVLFLLLALLERYTPGIALAICVWCIVAGSIIMIQSRTLDAYEHGTELWQRVKQRVKGYRLPFRVEIRRAN